jgi:hypothetical protein
MPAIKRVIASLAMLTIAAGMGWCAIRGIVSGNSVLGLIGIVLLIAALGVVIAAIAPMRVVEKFLGPHRAPSASGGDMSWIAALLELFLGP